MDGDCHVLLLTATVIPPDDVFNLARRDPGLRLADYLDAFDFYLQQLSRGAFTALVLCENSGFGLAPFAERVRAAKLDGRVELLSHFGLDHPGAYGRGYGEFKLVDHAMHHSTLIATAAERVQVWKVTGRYKFLNIGRLIRTQPADADLYCNCRDIPRRSTDLYLMRWNRRAYDRFIRGVYRSLQLDATPVYSEQRFRGLLDAAGATLRVAPRFCTVPRIDGRRGVDGRPCQTLPQYLRRVVVNRLMPWHWK